MNTPLKSRTLILSGAALLGVALLAIPSFAAPKKASPSPGKESAAETAVAPKTEDASSAKAAGGPGAEEMAKMMEMAKPNENHKLLAEMAGSYTYTVKMWMAPGAPPTESKGTATRKMVLDGHYLSGEYTGKFKMPGADGKMKDMEFKGMSLDAYDNVKQKFVSSWADNMGTGIMQSEGTYDASSKTFNFAVEYDMMPGMHVKVREVIKTTDKDHTVMEFYEDRGQGENKTMEISYTRGGKK